MTPRLSCRDVVELVTDYLDGALAGPDARRFEQHVAACDGCAAYVESIRVTVRALDEVPPEPADPHVREHLLAAFRDLRG